MSTSGPVRLKRLELENFRGFEKLALDFEDDLTVIVGANGAGKTTVLDAIVCAVNGNVRLMDARSGTTSSKLGLTVGAAGASNDCTLDFAVQSHGGVQTEPSFLPPEAWPTIFVYRVNRQVQDKTYIGGGGQRWTRDMATDNWAVASITFDDFFRWFKDLEDLENEQLRYAEGAQSLELAAVRRAIRALLPEFEEIRIRRRMPPLAVNPVLVLRKGDVELPFDALSEGERTTIAMVGDIARRLVLLGEHEDPLQTSATVLIDEIEQHAHPGWQRQILRRFRHTFPNVQLITTTHSPIIVSEVEPRQLRVLKNFALVPPEHGPGRDANAVLEDVFKVPPRKQEVHDSLEALAAAIDSDDFEKADRLLVELDTLVPGGEDPDIVYYRNLLAMMRAS